MRTVKILLSILVVLLVLEAGGIWMLLHKNVSKDNADPSSTSDQIPMEEEQTEETQEKTFELILDGKSYGQDATEIQMSSATNETLELLRSMPDLERVTMTDGGDGTNAVFLRDFCAEKGIEFQISLNNQIVTEEEVALSFVNLTENQAQLLMTLSHLESVHLSEPEASAETLIKLRETLPNTEISWSKTVLGMTFSSETDVIDLTDMIACADEQLPDEKTAYEYGCEEDVMSYQEEVPSSIKVTEEHPLPDKQLETIELVAEVEAAMDYFPNAEKMVMCGAWLDNETMAQFRDRHREEYKVVWSVQCGPLATRTDTTFFMPTKYNVRMKAFSDLNTYNLRYCEEIISMDLGHMLITDLEFVRFMPNLKYLVLSWTYVEDLSPLSSCKNLVLFEMNWVNRVTDYSPLVECTALEDLNIGETYGDITPLLQMTWLKNFWIVGCQEGSYEKAREALPDTNIGYFYGDPVAGWRELPNYFKMRDALLMFYMN